MHPHGARRRLEFWGHEEAAALVLVDAETGGIGVVRTGTLEECVAAFESDVGRAWSAAIFQVVHRAVPRVFLPTGGRFVLGFFEAGRVTYLLARLGPRLAVVRAEGSRLGVVYAGVGPLPILDLDLMHQERLVPSRDELRAAMAGLAARCKGRGAKRADVLIRELTPFLVPGAHDLVGQVEQLRTGVHSLLTPRNLLLDPPPWCLAPHRRLTRCRRWPRASKWSRASRWPRASREPRRRHAAHPR